MIFHCVTVVDLSHDFFLRVRIDCWQILQMESDLNCKIFHSFIFKGNMNTNYFYLNIMISRHNNKKETGKKSLLYFTDISKALKALCKAE